jgi:myo-inositol 2-dehydrogenase/D-chiro-inositol 1-dehydrogenase
MIRLALIGCGEHSRTSHAMPLARYAAQHPHVIELCAACDMDLERAKEFCREFGFSRAYSDADEMLSTERLDGCICVMPMHSIVRMAVMLMERKTPCVIEKPLGISSQEAERLAVVARETGTPHMVSVNRRFMPYLNEGKLWASAVGPLQYVRATQIRNARDESDFIWSTAIHTLDALRYIAGEIVSFETDVYRQPELSALWYGISLRFANGARGRLEVLPTAGMVEETYELFGESFRVQIVAGSGVERSLHCWRDGHLEVERISSEADPEDLRNGAYEEVVEFVRALKTGTPPKPSVEDILPSARICFAIAESADRPT